MSSENALHHEHEHHEVELSVWPLVIGLASLLIPFAFMAAFQWSSPVIGLLLTGVSVVLLLIGCFGWASEVYSKNQDVGLSKIAILIFIISEILLFGGLFGGYFYNMLPAEVWPPANTPDHVPPLGLALFLSIFLLSSSGTIHVAEMKLEKGDMGGFKGWLCLTIILGLLFIIGQAKEWAGLIGEGFTVSTNAFGTFFFTITGFHGSHVIVGLILQIFVLLLGSRITKKSHTIVKATGYYWHFVDGIWLLVLSLMYILPYYGI